jgi:hypothetical protein
VETPDQVHHHLTTDERSAAPIRGDVAEHAMLDFVPLAGSRREMTNLNRQAQFIRQFLQLPSP